jgi:hypothetical protein
MDFYHFRRTENDSKFAFVNNRCRRFKANFKSLKKPKGNYNQGSWVNTEGGGKINIDKELAGECDYLMALGHKVIDFVSTPFFSIVEAKRQDMEYGTAQCTAQLIGAKKYNELDGIELPYLYGATTDGQKWRFMRFKDNVLTIHETYFSLDNLPVLLGVFSHLIDDCRTFNV